MAQPPPNIVRILAFAGSLRRGSYNRALVRTAAEVAPDGVTVDTFDLEGIPLFNADVEVQGYPDRVQEFHQAISDSDALLIATPEYQHGIPGVLKNAIDWASRPPRTAAIIGKPVAIMGAAPGLWGTARAQVQLRQVLVYNNCPMVMKPEVLVANAKERFDEEGRLVHEATRVFIRELLESLGALAHRYR
jgi:chromate reductase, NAD(P)H dehydrogenase (quinone)